VRLIVGAQLASIKLLYLVKDAIKLGNRLLNFIPGLVLVASIGSRKFNTLGGHLAINCNVGLVHSVELFVSFTQFLELEGWVN